MVGALATGDTSFDRGGLLMLRNLAISTVLLAGVISVAHADVYRWVDDHGGVHYSDQWVPGSEVIKSNRPHPTTSTADTGHRSSDTPKASSDRSGAQPSDQNVQKAVKQDVAKVREQQCKEAKERYDKAIQARRIFKASQGDKSKESDRPDDRQYMSDEEADAYRLQTRKDMQDVCGDSAK
jgi:Domain of unknown function (DUF4124)